MQCACVDAGHRGLRRPGVVPQLLYLVPHQRKRLHSSLHDSDMRRNPFESDQLDRFYVIENEQFSSVRLSRVDYLKTFLSYFLSYGLRSSHPP